MESELDKCPICLNNIIQEGVNIYSYDEDTLQKSEITQLKCNHLICKHCLKQWLEKSLYCTCPICTTSISDIVIEMPAKENRSICTQKCMKILLLTLFLIFVIIIIYKLFVTK